MNIRPQKIIRITEGDCTGVLALVIDKEEEGFDLVVYLMPTKSQYEEIIKKWPELSHNEVMNYGLKEGQYEALNFMPEQTPNVNVLVETTKGITSIYCDQKVHITKIDHDMKTFVEYEECNDNFAELYDGEIKYHFREGDLITVNDSYDELAGITGCINEVRTLDEKEHENPDNVEVICELEPSLEQEERINKEFPHLNLGFGFDYVVLTGNQVKLKDSDF